MVYHQYSDAKTIIDISLYKSLVIIFISDISDKRNT